MPISWECMQVMMCTSVARPAVTKGTRLDGPPYHPLPSTCAAVGMRGVPVIQPTTHQLAFALVPLARHALLHTVTCGKAGWGVLHWGAGLAVGGGGVEHLSSWRRRRPPRPSMAPPCTPLLHAPPTPGIIPHIIRAGDVEISAQHAQHGGS